MEPSIMDSIAARLSTVDNLYFPGCIHSPGPPPPSRLKSLLLDLLFRDPPLFLERYGSHLTPPELRPLETLAPRTYELGFHLSRLKTSRAPVAAATVKNRRRAYLDRLVGAGDYFSEEAMREREPWLHYDLARRFPDPAGGAVVRDADATVGGGGDGEEDQGGAVEARGREEGLDRRRGGGGRRRRRRTDGGGFGFGLEFEFEFRLGIKPRTF